MFYGNGKPNYYLFTDNQAAEHIATQPNMNDHSRSIVIRHHAIRQDFMDGEMRIGGVATQDNTSDILTKNLQPPLHVKHTRELNITQNEKQTITNCVQGLTLHSKQGKAARPHDAHPPDRHKVIPRQRTHVIKYKMLPNRPQCLRWHCTAIAVQQYN